MCGTLWVVLHVDEDHPLPGVARVVEDHSVCEPAAVQQYIGQRPWKQEQKNMRPARPATSPSRKHFLLHKDFKQ